MIEVIDVLSILTYPELGRHQLGNASLSVSGIFSPLSENPLMNHVNDSTSLPDTKPSQKSLTVDKAPLPLNREGMKAELASRHGASEAKSTPKTKKLQEGSTPSPLTISAQDIDGGSIDFTELASGMDVSFRLHDGIGGQSSSHSMQQLEESDTRLRQQMKHLVLTPPQNTSSPSGPIRVRMSSKKLREIQSPYSSDQSPLSDASSAEKESNRTPRALTPLAVEHHPPTSVCKLNFSW